MEKNTSKKRKVISLNQKLEIIKRFEKGERKIDIGRALGLNEATVRTILRESEKFKREGQKASTSIGTQSTRNRSDKMIEMERLLLIWIEDCNHTRIPLSTNIIKTKALAIFSALKDDDFAGEKNFVASPGWFERFKKRSGLHNVRIQGEAASADKEGAEKFVIEFRKLIEDEGYELRQIFNVDETALFWKRMPSKTYLAKDEKVSPGYKTSKDRITLLVGGNADGDFKLKPMLINRTQNPRALRLHNKNSLPVLWRANKKAWVTKSLFEDWFISYFCPEVKKYCEKSNLAFKVILLLDNAPGHPPSMGDLNENVKIVFLPPNTTPLLQPMDLGVIATFKAIYLRTTFENAVRAVASDNPLSLKEFWKNFTIKDAIENIKVSWDHLTSSNMRAVWKELLPECANDFVGFDQNITNVVDEIEAMGIELGFDEVDCTNIRELLDTPQEEMSVEDLINLDQQRAYELKDDEPINEEETLNREITLQQFNELFRRSENLKQQVLDIDCDLERSLKVRRLIDKALSCYDVMYEEKKKKKTIQKTLDNFLIKKN